MHRIVGGMEADEIIQQIGPFMEGTKVAADAAAKPKVEAPVASAEAVEAVKQAIAGNDVTVFSKTTCPFCEETKMLLEMMDVPYVTLPCLHFTPPAITTTTQPHPKPLHATTAAAAIQTEHVRHGNRSDPQYARQPRSPLGSAAFAALPNSSTSTVTRPSSSTSARTALTCSSSSRWSRGSGPCLTSSSRYVRILVAIYENTRS